MANFTTANPSYDAGLAQWGINGGLPVFYSVRTAGGTVSTVASGGTNSTRYSRPFIVPSVGTGVQGYIVTQADIHTNAVSQHHLCLEYALGTITLNGNVFSGSATMPTKTINGVSTQTASSLAFLCVTTTGTATAPVITITYTNQDGTANQTATLTLPNSPIADTAFFINRLLATGDTGIRTVTNISSSVTTGTLVMKVYGCLTLVQQACAGANVPVCSAEPLLTPLQVPYLCTAGEAINVYRTGSAAAADVWISMALTPEAT